MEGEYYKGEYRDKDTFSIADLRRIAWRDAPHLDGEEEGVDETTLEVDTKNRELVFYDENGVQWGSPCAWLWHREIRDAASGKTLSRHWCGMVDDFLRGVFDHEELAEEWVLYAVETWLLASHARHQAEEARCNIAVVDEAIEQLKGVRALMEDTAIPVLRLEGCLDALAKARGDDQ